ERPIGGPLGRRRVIAQSHDLPESLPPTEKPTWLPRWHRARRKSPLAVLTLHFFRRRKRAGSFRTARAQLLHFSEKSGPETSTDPRWEHSPRARTAPPRQWTSGVCAPAAEGLVELERNIFDIKGRHRIYLGIVNIEGRTAAVRRGEFDTQLHCLYPQILLPGEFTRLSVLPRPSR